MSYKIIPLFALLTFGASAAHAQDAVTTPTATPAAEANATESAGSQADVPAVETTEEKVSSMSERLDGIGERLSEFDSSIKALQKIKISGYLQARYESRQDSWNGLDDRKSGDFKTGSGKAGQSDTFYIRRGRVKFTFAANEWSEMVIQPDLARGGVTLKDAWVDLKEQWTGTQTIRVGQFNIPYGYEIEQSSSVRELPERSRWERTVFANERERGAALYGKVNILRYSVAALNGNGSEDKDTNFRGVDNNFSKQYIGRVGFDAIWLIAGVSGSSNIKLIPAIKKQTPAATADINYNGTIDAKEVDVVSAGQPNKQYKEQLAGAYLLFFQDVPYLGGFSLKGEYNRGWSGSFSDELGNTKTKAGFLLPERRVKMLGWHALVSQFIGDRNQLVYRIDQFDADLESREKDCHKLKKHPTDTEGCHLTRTTTHTMAWNFFWDGNVRLTSALEVPRQLAWRDRKDATFTEQVQYKF